MIVVRAARPEDVEFLCEFRCALWPDGSADGYSCELDAFFAGRSCEPLEVLVAEGGAGQLLGFVELSIHRYAEGCTTDRVGYLEGWYVIPEVRGQGVGRALVEAAEAWARAQGCTEFASDAAVDNDVSTAAHKALGFDEVGLIRCFRKDL
ncbi:MAG: GNAT family N-acetyltransferase [Candidatus Poribacteria bacterium]|nr:GNAT family N-acetyltransferase [Candidatus Poribacteria bacterium]